MATDETTHDDEPAPPAPHVPDSGAPDDSTADDGGGGELHGLLAEFETPGALIAAARKVKNAGYTEFDCYSPFPVHGIDDAMGIKRTRLPLAVFIGGVAGFLGGAVLQWWMNAHNWPWNVGGKPTWSIPANVPIAYETTILLSVLTTFFGMWAANKLPQVWHPFFRLDRFADVTDDGLFLGIEAGDKRFELQQTKQLLVAAGATHVEECYLDPRPEQREVPRPVWAAMTVLTIVAIIPFAIAFKARASKSSVPHWHVFSDMDYQAKAKSDQAFDEFSDGRANRGEIPGTIARGSLDADDAFNRGLRDGQWIRDLPADVVPTKALLDRGQERFNIYCSPCHGYDGAGHGIVPERVAAFGGAWEARNLVAPNSVAITMPNGQLFNTISNGYNTMMGYAAQVPTRDRWAILLYVRALQRAQNAVRDELPAGATVR